MGKKKQQDENTVIGESPLALNDSLLGSTVLETNPFGASFEQGYTEANALDMTDNLPESAVISLDLGSLDSESKNKKYLTLGLSALGLIGLLVGGLVLYSFVTKEPNSDIVKNKINKLEEKAISAIKSQIEIDESPADVIEIDELAYDSSEPYIQSVETNTLPDHQPIVTLGEVSDDQFSKWEDMIDHQFVYQHYKATEQMNEMKLSGVEELLALAIKKPKFWTRMQALAYYVKLGKNVGPERMKVVIGDARPSLIRNYLKRFQNTTDPHEQKVVLLVQNAVSGMY